MVAFAGGANGKVHINGKINGYSKKSNGILKNGKSQQVT